MSANGRRRAVIRYTMSNIEAVGANPMATATVITFLVKSQGIYPYTPIAQRLDQQGEGR
jgi:hypothetical protein